MRNTAIARRTGRGPCAQFLLLLLVCFCAAARPLCAQSQGSAGTNPGGRLAFGGGIPVEPAPPEGRIPDLTPSGRQPGDISPDQPPAGMEPVPASPAGPPDAIDRWFPPERYAWSASSIDPMYRPDGSYGMRPGIWCDMNRHRFPENDVPRFLFPQDWPVRLYGWVDGGYMGNTSSPVSQFNGPYSAVDIDRAQFNQTYLILEAPRPADASFGVGFRADALYGSDFWLAQSAGFELDRDGSNHWNNGYYGIAIPQAYVDVGNDELSVRAGHFYTLVGYESVASANNFFYTHSYSYQFATPFTHWGAIAAWNADDNVKIEAGAVNGWDALDAVQNHVSFIGRATYTSDENDWWASASIVRGLEPTNQAHLVQVQNAVANRTRYSIIFSKRLDPQVEYVFYHWLGMQEDGSPTGSAAWWYGIDQYLYYLFSDTLRFAARFEWFRDEEGTRVGVNNRPANPNNPPLPGNYFAISLGMNFLPTANLTIRPEARYDAVNGPSLPYADGTKKYQMLLGLDAIMRF